MSKSVDVIFFLSCYFLAFLLEIIRLRWKQSIAFKAAVFVMLILGTLVHGYSLYNHGLLQNAHFFANARGWFYVLAFGLVLVLSYLTLAYPRTPFSLFLFPPILATIIVGINVPDIVFSVSRTGQWIRAIHGVSLLLTTLCSCLGTIAGLMYFLQRSRMKRKVFTAKISLPSLEWLSYAIRHASNVAFLMLGIGVVSGFYLKAFVSKSVVDPSMIAVDRVMLGGTLLFIFAFCLRLRSFWKRRFDPNDLDAILAFTLCLALIVLLLFAAFENNGHWKTLIHTVPQDNLINVELSPYLPAHEKLDVEQNRP